MAKKLIGSFKLQIPAGQASMAPPVGPAFGQRGLNGMEFVKQFNAKTQKDGGILTPAIISFFSDKSFTFIVKSPPASTLIMKAASLGKGSAESNRTKVGKVTRKQLEEIYEIKKDDLNCSSVDSAVSMLAGTARSMGVTVEE
jgi:large subunit ribosomal protein L11